MKSCKLQRFMFKAPLTCTIFCFTLTHRVWITYGNVCVGQLSKHSSKPLSRGLSWPRQKYFQKHVTKNFVALAFTNYVTLVDTCYAFKSLICSSLPLVLCFFFRRILCVHFFVRIKKNLKHESTALHVKQYENHSQ